jgi:hypothetical protein
MKNLHIYIFCLFLLSCFTQAIAVPAFPVAEGFGAVSVGGRGGQVIEVNILADSGPGSLRAAYSITENMILGITI